jgi:hypothetical protein
VEIQNVIINERRIEKLYVWGGHGKAKDKAEYRDITNDE